VVVSDETRKPDPGAGARPDPKVQADAETPGRPAPSLQEIAVRSALETVLDPEIGLSVIELGLIREIRFEPGTTRIRMLLTTPFCPYAPQLMAEVKQAAMSVVPQRCEVELLPDPWSPQLMPDPSLLGFSF
jgi:metal-sulfur cluster biosynthetic enzyme